MNFFSCYFLRPPASFALFCHVLKMFFFAQINILPLHRFIKFRVMGS